MHVGIFLGLDGLGKTPLVELCKMVDPGEVRTAQLLQDPRKLSPGTPLRLAEQEVAKWELAKGNVKYEGKILLYDRFPHPDDFVYQEFSQKPQEKSLSDFRHQMLERRMRGVGVKLVYLKPPSWPKYLRRMEKDPDLIVTDAQAFHLIRQRYETYFAETTLQVLEITARHFIGEDAEEVLDWIRKDEDA